MTSIIKADNISTVSGSGNITIPTGVKVVGTDSGSIVAPGQVIQTVHFSSGVGSELTTTGNTYISTGSEGTVTITPKFANSYIRVTATFNADTAATNSRAMYTFFRSINGGSYSNVRIVSDANKDSLARIHELGERILVQQYIEWFDTTHNTTNAVSYQLRFRNQNSGETARVRNDITPTTMCVQEIAQ